MRAMACGAVAATPAASGMLATAPWPTHLSGWGRTTRRGIPLARRRPCAPGRHLRMEKCCAARLTFSAGALGAAACLPQTFRGESDKDQAPMQCNNCTPGAAQGLVLTRPDKQGVMPLGGAHGLRRQSEAHAGIQQEACTSACRGTSQGSRATAGWSKRGCWMPTKGALHMLPSHHMQAPACLPLTHENGPRQRQAPAQAVGAQREVEASQGRAVGGSQRLGAVCLAVGDSAEAKHRGEQRAAECAWQRCSWQAAGRVGGVNGDGEAHGAIKRWLWRQVGLGRSSVCGWCYSCRSRESLRLHHWVCCCGARRLSSAGQPGCHTGHRSQSSSRAFGAIGVGLLLLVERPAARLLRACVWQTALVELCECHSIRKQCPRA